MGGIGPEEADPKVATSAAGDDGIENLLPVICTVVVTVAQGLRSSIRNELYRKLLWLPPVMQKASYPVGV